MKQLLLAGLLVIWAVAPAWAANAANAQVVREGEDVAVVGQVERAVAYGPPTFGANPKTDEREAYFALKGIGLLRVKNMSGEFASEATTRVQLVFAGHDKTLPDIVAGTAPNRRLCVAGKVMLPETGHHHEVVLILVQSAKVLE